MTTSGTASFNLDLTEIVEEAFERAGVSCVLAMTCALLVDRLIYFLLTGQIAALTCGRLSRAHLL